MKKNLPLFNVDVPETAAAAAAAAAAARTTTKITAVVVTVTDLKIVTVVDKARSAEEMVIQVGICL